MILLSKRPWVEEHSKHFQNVSKPFRFLYVMFEIIRFLNAIPSRKLTYPSMGIAKSSSNMPPQGDMLVPWRVIKTYYMYYIQNCITYGRQTPESPLIPWISF